MTKSLFRVGDGPRTSGPPWAHSPSVPVVTHHRPDPTLGVYVKGVLEGDTGTTKGL